MFEGKGAKTRAKKGLVKKAGDLLSLYWQWNTEI